MRRVMLRFSLGLLAGLALSMGAVLALAAGRQQAPATWQVAVGAESADQGWQAQAFFPGVLTINEGDSVVWTMNANFVHTVSFLSGAERPPDVVPAGDGERMMQNPAGAFPSGGPTYDGTGLTNSGVLQGTGANYTLTFSQAGTYPYLCLLHPGMVGQVVVQPADSPYPQTQAEVDAQGEAEATTLLARADEAQKSAPNAAAQTRNANGTTTYTVVNGIGGNQASVLRFLPGDLEVRVGDSVSFPVRDPHEIHSVTFYDSAGEVPPFIVPEEQAGGPPNLIIPHAAPAGGTEVSDPKTFYNSGILGPDQSYTFKFTAPGEYTYVCMIHAPQGMVGTITVSPAGPNPLMWLGLGAVALAAIGIVALLWRRRSAPRAST
jgi:plastocyanin